MTPGPTSTTPTLITFPPSLDSEFARFLLAHHGIAYSEERHVIGPSVVATMRAGLTPAFPLLVGDGYRLKSVRAMVEHFEAGADPSRQLVPDEPWEAAYSDVDWQFLRAKLASPTTAFAYFHLLPDRALMAPVLSAGAPAWEVSLMRRGYPAFAALLRGLLRLDATKAADAAREIDELMAMVDERLRDGRAYLHGDRFSLSDMSFAVSAAPCTWPPEYGGSIPPLEATPPAVQDMVRRQRDRPAGQLALRIYHERRGG